MKVAKKSSGAYSPRLSFRYKPSRAHSLISCGGVNVSATSMNPVQTCSFAGSAIIHPDWDQNNRYCQPWKAYETIYLFLTTAKVFLITVPNTDLSITKLRNPMRPEKDASTDARCMSVSQKNIPGACSHCPWKTAGMKSSTCRHG